MISLQLLISIAEYKTHCMRLKLPADRVKITCEKGEVKSSVAQQLLMIAERERVDFLVVGAYGKGGPAVDQVHHVPWDSLRSTSPIPRIVVPPAYLNSVISKRYVFVLAVDKSANAARCLNAALKLMRPVDMLRIIHFYDKPIVGEYDTKPLEWYRDTIAEAGIDGVMECRPVECTSTIAESLQDYLSLYAAAYLVLGINGEGAEKKAQSIKKSSAGDEEVVTGEESQGTWIGRLPSAMLFSPR